MGRYDSAFLRSPKMEEQQVPDDDSNLTKFADTNKINKDEVDVMDDLEHILAIEEEDDDDDNDENYLSKNNNIYNGTAGHQLNWEFTNWNEFPNNNNNNYYYGEDLEEEEEEEEMKEHKCFYEENKYYNKIIKKENVRFWDIEDESKVSDLKLNLNYQEVLDAWSNRGSLWADDYSLSASTCSGYYMGEVPVLMEEERTRRKASVMRYKEKRQNRLFSKKIRYQVRKLNADKRPRLKGRFVKRVSQL